jgi:polygalacturonase
VTISNCFVPGNYALGSVASATWKPVSDLHWPPTGRIKLGTESNGGFKRITIDNCVFESCRGVAIESVDGAICEDITITNLAMRDVRSAPIFMRLGSRLRGPAGTQTGAIRRVLISNISSSGAGRIPSILAGVPGYPIEDVQISGCFFEQTGGGDEAMAARVPAELESGYPEPEMFGELPATGFFVRHARNLVLSNMEVRVTQPDKRPAFWLRDVVGLRFNEIRLPQGAPVLNAAEVRRFRSADCDGLRDGALEKLDGKF